MLTAPERGTTVLKMFPRTKFYGSKCLQAPGGSILSMDLEFRINVLRMEFMLWPLDKMGWNISIEH
jgi:hypothetical protein